jgi:hypothetical protein
MTAVILAASPMAFAATQTTTGMVKSFDSKAMTLTLQDGTIFYLPKGLKDPGLKSEEKVAISWSMQNNQHDASSVKIVK